MFCSVLFFVVAVVDLHNRYLRSINVSRIHRRALDFSHFQFNRFSVIICDYCYYYYYYSIYLLSSLYVFFCLFLRLPFFITLHNFFHVNIIIFISFFALLFSFQSLSILTTFYLKCCCFLGSEFVKYKIERRPNKINERKKKIFLCFFSLIFFLSNQTRNFYFFFIAIYLESERKRAYLTIKRDKKKEKNINYKVSKLSIYINWNKNNTWKII